MSDYTNRRQEIITITKNDGGSVTTDSGWSVCVNRKVSAALPVGTQAICETVNYSQVVGWKLDTGWIMRKSDEDIEREHAEMVAGFARERRESLERNREQWQAKQDALPGWIRERLETFHAKGGELFALEGWGYELCVAELAVAYVASNLADDDKVNAISREQGTSGNQHDCAKAIARMHLASKPVGETVSALSPLTGDPFYAGRAS